jgi:transcriptional regulator with XRE-family HTH domain
MRRLNSPSPLARALREIRHEQGIDQLTLALAMGAGDASYLSRLECGIRANPSSRFLGRVVLAYAAIGCPLSPDQRARLGDSMIAMARIEVDCHGSRA